MKSSRPLDRADYLQTGTLRSMSHELYSVQWTGTNSERNECEHKYISVSAALSASIKPCKNSLFYPTFYPRWRNPNLIWSETEKIQYDMP